jgi:peptide/nickel transport system substrate-binding protein
MTAFDDSGGEATNDVNLISIGISDIISEPNLDGPPSSLITVSNDLVEVEDEIVLDGSSSYGWREHRGDIVPDPSKIERYEWDLGDGTETDGANITHTYSSSGSYFVELTVYLADGQSGTSGRTIRVVNPGESTGIIKNSNTYIYATDKNPMRMDPVWHTGTMHREMMVNLGENLLRRERGDVEHKPWLAESYEVTNNGKTWTFQLKEGVKFWDGSEMTAEDVEYTWQRALAMNTPYGGISSIVEYMTGYKKGEKIPEEVIFDTVKAIDEFTVEFNFVEPFGAFSNSLGGTTIVIISKDYAIEHGSWYPGDPKDWTAKSDEAMDTGEAFMATGPYKLVTFSRNEKCIATRHDEYWRGPANIENWEMVYVPEFSSRFQMLENMDVDAIAVGSLSQANQITRESGEGIDLYQGDIGYIEFVWFQWLIEPERQPTGIEQEGIWPEFFHDKDLRDAFAYAFPYDTYIDRAYRNTADQVTGLLSTTTMSYLPNYNYKYDPEKATELFKKAWDGQVWEDGFTMVFGYQLWAKDASVIAYESLAESLKDINPKFNLIVQEGVWPTVLYWPLGVAYEAGGPDPRVLNTRYKSDNLFASYFRYNNSEVDTLLSLADAETDTEKRIEYLLQAQEIIEEEIPLILTVYTPEYHAMRDYLSGWYFQPEWQTLMGYVYDMEKGD